MEQFMNSLPYRALLMATLLPLSNMAVAAGDDDLFAIEVTPVHLENNEEQPVELKEDDHNGDNESGDILDIQPTTSNDMHPEMEKELLNLKLPSRGMNKNTVKNEFGTPLQMNSAVGCPCFKTREALNMFGLASIPRIADCLNLPN